MQMSLIALATINMFEQSYGQTDKVVGVVYVVTFSCVQAVVLLLSGIEFMHSMYKLCCKLYKK